MIPIHLRTTPENSGRIETYPHYEFIEHLAKWIKPINYLEIGVRHGTTYKVVEKHCQNCYLVDLKFHDIGYSENTVRYEMSSDDFFVNVESDKKFDLVFIDGDHSKDQVLKDFQNVEKMVIDDGFVILHDTYPCDERMIDPEYSNNCWEAMLEIKKNYQDRWEYLTLPFNPGLSLLKKMSRDKQIIWK